MNTKRYGLKAINDEATECEVCGKVELKRVMWLVALDSDGNEEGQPFAVGTTCGAKMLSYTISKVNTICNNFEHNIWQMKQAAINSHPATKEQHVLLQELNKLGLRYAERKIHPLYIAAKEKQQEAENFANSQNFVVEIR